MTRIILPLIAAALLASPARSPATLRSELVLRINGERDHAGMPPVAPSAALDRVAQERADEIKARGALPGEAEAMTLLGRVQLRMARAGYSAHGWTESQISTVGDPGAVIAAWRADPSAAQAMDSNYQDVGVGVADLHGVPLYVFLFA
ncbi:MAG TPA: CAP domain-containing protein, partial [Thermoanaerobaculia bacterium]